jgi:hypothetical protein
MLNNITTLTSTQWYLGLPFGYPVNVTGIVNIARIYEHVLGNNLLALQLGQQIFVSCLLYDVLTCIYCLYFPR